MTLPRQHHPLCAEVNDAAPCDCGLEKPHRVVVVECDCEPDWVSVLIWVALAFALAAVVGLNLGYWFPA